MQTAGSKEFIIYSSTSFKTYCQAFSCNIIGSVKKRAKKSYYTTRGKEGGYEGTSVRYLKGDVDR